MVGYKLKLPYLYECLRFLTNLYLCAGCILNDEFRINMTLLLFYLFLAVFVSFLCSICEAVLLSIRPSYLAGLESEKPQTAQLLKGLIDNIDRPLAAILTANTISHTVGAAGVGAQATVVFGNEYLGLISAVLTFVILIFSEIIPKTLGATFWQELAPSVGRIIQAMIKGLFPLVWLSEKLTKLISGGKTSAFTFSRDEVKAMVEIGKDEGVFTQEEHAIFTNMMKIRQISVRDIMTPRSVVFSLPDQMTPEQYFTKYPNSPFSRVPIFGSSQDDIVGYILKVDILAAIANDNGAEELSKFKRDFVALSDKITVYDAYSELISQKTHMALVLDEYGTVQGLVTLEDIIETIVGLEITDELDTVEDMQILARNRWRKRMEDMGVDIAKIP